LQQKKSTKPSLVDAERGAHGGLDVNVADVLPALLQERNQEVDADSNVLRNLLVREAEVGDRNAEAKNLLQLEADS